MTTKLDAKNTAVDWDAVERATEVRRTYLVRDKRGNEFFKMYKPSEAKRIFKAEGWTGQIISTLDYYAARKKS